MYLKNLFIQFELALSTSIKNSFNNNWLKNCQYCQIIFDGIKV
jgi:hypothetical protein